MSGSSPTIDASGELLTPTDSFRSVSTEDYTTDEDPESFVPLPTLLRSSSVLVGNQSLMSTGQLPDLSIQDEALSPFLSYDKSPETHLRDIEDSANPSPISPPVPLPPMTGTDINPFQTPRHLLGMSRQESQELLTSPTLPVLPVFPEGSLPGEQEETESVTTSGHSGGILAEWAYAAPSFHTISLTHMMSLRISSFLGGEHVAKNPKLLETYLLGSLERTSLGVPAYQGNGVELLVLWFSQMCDNSHTNAVLLVLALLASRKTEQDNHIDSNSLEMAILAIQRLFERIVLLQNPNLARDLLNSSRGEAFVNAVVTAFVASANVPPECVELSTASGDQLRAFSDTTYFPRANMPAFAPGREGIHVLTQESARGVLGRLAVVWHHSLSILITLSLACPGVFSTLLARSKYYTSIRPAIVFGATLFPFMIPESIASTFDAAQDAPLFVSPTTALPTALDLVSIPSFPSDHLWHYLLLSDALPEGLSVPQAIVEHALTVTLSGLVSVCSSSHPSLRALDRICWTLTILEHFLDGIIAPELCDTIIHALKVLANCDLPADKLTCRPRMALSIIQILSRNSYPKTIPIFAEVLALAAETVSFDCGFESTDSLAITVFEKRLNLRVVAIQALVAATTGLVRALNAANGMNGLAEITEIACLRVPLHVLLMIFLKLTPFVRLEVSTSFFDDFPQLIFEFTLMLHRLPVASDTAIFYNAFHHALRSAKAGTLVQAFIDQLALHLAGQQLISLDDPLAKFFCLLPVETFPAPLLQDIFKLGQPPLPRLAASYSLHPNVSISAEMMISWLQVGLEMPTYPVCSLFAVKTESQTADVIEPLIVRTFNRITVDTLPMLLHHRIALFAADSHSEFHDRFLSQVAVAFLLLQALDSADAGTLVTRAVLRHTMTSRKPVSRGRQRICAVLFAQFVEELFVTFKLDFSGEEGGKLIHWFGEIYSPPCHRYHFCPNCQTIPCRHWPLQFGFDGRYPNVIPHSSGAAVNIDPEPVGTLHSVEYGICMPPMDEISADEIQEHAMRQTFTFPSRLQWNGRFPSHSLWYSWKHHGFRTALDHPAPFDYDRHQWLSRSSFPGLEAKPKDIHEAFSAVRDGICHYSELAGGRQCDIAGRTPEADFLLDFTQSPYFDTPLDWRTYKVPEDNPALMYEPVIKITDTPTVLPSKIQLLEQNKPVEADIFKHREFTYEHMIECLHDDLLLDFTTWVTLQNDNKIDVRFYFDCGAGIFYEKLFIQTQICAIQERLCDPSLSPHDRNFLRMALGVVNSRFCG